MIYHCMGTKRTINVITKVRICKAAMKDGALYPYTTKSNHLVGISASEACLEFIIQMPESGYYFLSNPPLTIQLLTEHPLRFSSKRPAVSSTCGTNMARRGGGIPCAGDARGDRPCLGDMRWSNRPLECFKGLYVPFFSTSRLCRRQGG